MVIYYFSPSGNREGEKERERNIRGLQKDPVFRMELKPFSQDTISVLFLSMLRFLLIRRMEQAIL